MYKADKLNQNRCPSQFRFGCRRHLGLPSLLLRIKQRQIYYFANFSIVCKYLFFQQQSNYFIQIIISMKQISLSFSGFIRNSNKTQDKLQKYSKYSLMLFIVISILIKICISANTLPMAWNYQPTLIQCGKFKIASPSNTTVRNTRFNYTITFKRLVNPTTQYYPVLGFDDVDYMFLYNQHIWFATQSNFPTSTGFDISAWAYDADNRLSRYSINYLVVSNDLIDFYIWVDYTYIMINQIINAGNPYTTTKSLTQVLPTTINIKTIVSISVFDIAIQQASSNLYEAHLSINILNTASYNWTLKSPSANTKHVWIHFYVIFYQEVMIPYQQTLLIPFSFNWSIAYNSTAQMVYPNNLTDFFQVSNDNSFFALSGISSILYADFSVTYTSTFSMQLNFNLTKAITASIFIFRQPICPTNYVLQKTSKNCVCNNISCYPGCSSVIIDGVNSKCVFCSISDNFVFDSNENCVCKTGYQLNNETCQQICGDGIIFDDQCDDGNNVSGDGCSSQCNKQNGFQCVQNSNGVSVCQFKQNICFKLATIEKNDDNSAIFKFQAIGDYLPLPFSTNSFQIRKTLNLTILKNDSTICDINYSINRIYGQTVQVLVKFQETIEGYNATIVFNFNSTKYLSQDCTLNLICKGSKLPLIASKYVQQYNSIQKINLVIISLLSLTFIVSLLAPKWIGIEAMQVNQLIFFSQLLITDASNWPVAFEVFKYFKYSNGFNNIFSSQTVQTFSNNSKKWNFLDFQPAFILNFSVSFLLILIFLILFFLFRPNKKDNLKQQYQLLEKKNIKIKNIQLSVSHQSKIQRRIYQILINVSVLSLLQFLAAIISQLALLKNPFNKYNFVVPIQVNSLLMLSSIFGIVFVGFNLAQNNVLSQQTRRILKHKPQLQTYKGVNFIYHFLIGTFMFCFNSFTFKGVPVSALFFIAELLYVIYIYRLRPYKQCVWIHSVGFIFNRFGYLLFLVFITIKNLIVNLNEIVMLGMCYFVIGFFSIMILLSIVRLYYDLRLGQEYEKKMEDIRKAKQLEQKLLKKKREQYEIQQIRQNSRKNHAKTSLLNTKDKNIYRIETICQQERQVELLQFLQKKNWTKLQKEKYYYQRYAEKPLIWLEKHDRKQYQLRMNKIKEESKNKEKKKINQKDQKDKEKLEQFIKERRQELEEKKIKSKSKSKKQKKKA